jgi:cytochrome c2
MIQEGGAADTGEDTGPTPEVAAILEIEGDVAYGQYLSSECTACHIGEGGRRHSFDPGPHAERLHRGMAAYRSGERNIRS